MALENVGQGEVRVSIARLDRDGAFEVRNRLLRLSGLVKRRGERVLHHGMARVDRQRLPVAGEGFVMVAERRKGDPEAAESLGRVRLGRDRPAEQTDGVVYLISSGAKRAQSEQRLIMGWHHRQDELIKPVSLGQPALVVQTGGDLKRLLDVVAQLHIVPNNRYGHGACRTVSRLSSCANDRFDSSTASISSASSSGRSWS